MAGDHAAWIKQMTQIFGGSDSGGATGLLTKEASPGGGSPDDKGSKGAAPADDEDEKEDAADPAGKGAPSGGGGGAPAGGGGGGGAPAGGGGGGGGGGAGAGKSATEPSKGADPKKGGPAAGASNGDPASGGTGAAAPDPAAGKAASGGTPSTPAASAPKSSGNYSSAKEASNDAQQYLRDFDKLTAELKTAEDALKKLVDDSEASKKAIETSEKTAAEADKAIPPAPQVAAPKGDTPQAQYDSAIQIKGDTLKVQQDAQVQIDAVREQRDATHEKSSAIENAHKLAAPELDKIKSLNISAEVDAESVVTAANDARALAAESKQKADQAEKDKSADADKLKTAAKEDAQFATTAQEAAGKAQAAAKQIAASLKGAEATLQNLEKIKQESQAAFDARSKQAASADQKLLSHMEAGNKAEIQEQEYKDKLSKEDAEAVLIKRYEALGGDAELKKGLEEQDNAFEIEGEKYRTEIKKWHDDTVRQLDDFKKELEPALKMSEVDTPKWDEWIKREEPIGQKVTADLNALGDKLKTERVKELASEIQKQTDGIADWKRWNAEDLEALEAMKVAKHALDERYRAADAELSAGEKYLADARTELNNELEMQNMTLEQKVNFLQYQPQIVRDRYKKRMEGEIARLVRENAANRDAEITNFQPSHESYAGEPIDWKPMQDKIAEFQKMSLEELQKEDDATYELEKKYRDAGGDEALFKKNMDMWKQIMQEADALEKQQAADQQKRSEQLRQQFDRAAEREKASSGVAKQYKAVQEQQKVRFEELKTKENTTSLSDQERAEYKLLDRSMKNLDTKIKDLVGEEVMRSFSKNTSEALVEAQRKLYDAKRADYQKLIPKPTSEAIQKMPVKEKYRDLTGRDE